MNNVIDTNSRSTSPIFHFGNHPRITRADIYPRDSELRSIYYERFLFVLDLQKNLKLERLYINEALGMGNFPGPGLATDQEQRDKLMSRLLSMIPMQNEVDAERIVLERHLGLYLPWRRSRNQAKKSTPASAPLKAALTS